MEILPEVEVWYALPAIRNKLALVMKKKGLSQKEIAEKLGIAESAVSQYVSGKRGKASLPKDLDEEFRLSADRIITGDIDSMVKEILRLSEVLKHTRVICDIHREHGKNVPANCSCCFE